VCRRKHIRVQSYLSADGANMHKFNRIRQVAPMCPHGRNLANTIELLRRCGLMSNYFDHLLYLALYTVYVFCLRCAFRFVFVLCFNRRIISVLTTKSNKSSPAEIQFVSFLLRYVMLKNKSQYLICSDSCQQRFCAYSHVVCSDKTFIKTAVRCHGEY